MRRGGVSLTHSRSPPPQFALVEKGIYRSAYPAESNVAYLRHVGIHYVVVLSIERLPRSVRRALDGRATRTNTVNSHHYNGSSEDVGTAAAPAGYDGNATAAATESTNVHARSTETQRSSAKLSTGRNNSGVIPVIEIADMRSWQNDDLSEGDDFSQADVQRALAIAVDTRFHPVLFTCPLGELQTNVVVGCMRRYQCWTLASIYSECQLFATVTRTLRSTVLNFIAQWDPDDCQPASADVTRHLIASSSESVNKQATSIAFSDTVANATSTIAVKGQDNTVQNTTDSNAPMPPQSFGSSMTTIAAANANTTITDSSQTMCGYNVASLATACTATTSYVDTVSQTSYDTLARHLPPYVAEWYITALIYRQRRRSSYAEDFARDTRPRAQQYSLSTISGGAAHSSALSNKTVGGDGLTPDVASQALPPPHMRYRHVRNPPSLDARSTFTKESLVEEDDD